MIAYDTKTAFFAGIIVKNLVISVFLIILCKSVSQAYFKKKILKLWEAISIPLHKFLHSAEEKYQLDISFLIIILFLIQSQWIYLSCKLERKGLYTEHGPKIEVQSYSMPI